MLEMNYAIGHTSYLQRPDITWPAPLAKLLKAYDVEWEKFDAASIAYLEARDAATSADEQDQALLRASLSEGKGDPGTPNQAAATRALVVEDQRLSLARESLAAAETRFVEAVP